MIYLIALKIRGSVERNLNDRIAIRTVHAELARVTALNLGTVYLNLKFGQCIRLDNTFFRRET